MMHILTKFMQGILLNTRPTKSTGPWDRRSQKKIDPRRKFSKLKKKKKNENVNIS